MPAAAGDIARTELITVQSVPVAASTTITKGEIVSFDAGGDCITATSTLNVAILGRGVALETIDNSAGADGDLNVRILTQGQVYVLAGAAIVRHVAIEVDATAGRAGPAAVGATVEWNLHLWAHYVGHENEELAATDAADNDIIIARFL